MKKAVVARNEKLGYERENCAHGEYGECGECGEYGEYGSPEESGELPCEKTALSA